MALRRQDDPRLQGRVRGVFVIARITVSRQSADDIAQREIFVAIDGDELAILRHGETATREISGGRHRLRAHNTLFRKVLDVDLGADEHAHFNVINKAGWGTYALMSVLGAGPLYLTVERVERD